MATCIFARHFLWGCVLSTVNARLRSVVDGLKTNLVGLSVITTLELAIRNDTTDTDFPAPTLETEAHIMQQFPTVSQGLGNLDEDYEIHLKPEAAPYSLYVARYVPVQPLPKVDDTLAQLSGDKVFSNLDADIRFWQIPLSRKSWPLTTFIMHFGHYCFNKTGY